MVSTFENIRVDDNSYNSLLSLLRNKTGLNFEYYNKSFIEKRIKARMIRVKCTTLDDYYRYISTTKGEIKKFVEGFTVNYTFFFRDYDVFETFQDLIIHGLRVKTKDITSNIRPNSSKLTKFRSKANAVKNSSKMKSYNGRPERFYIDIFIFLNQLSYFQKMRKLRSEQNCINIWSCPCATGEEPYSIAMILDNLESQVPSFPKYRIVASDIAQEAIHKAKIGVYTNDSMKEISDYFEKKYFTKQKTHFGHNNSIQERIKNKIEFIEEDVTQGHKLPYRYDIIFCRYLLIYFNRVNRHKFLSILENRLAENGILVLGKTETLFDSWGSLKLIDTRNRIYIKSHSNLY
ncbi:MAG: CheR family methyltransferase [Promethearchaeota archaeon]|jgi:chemotaxis methyl-accepting protein methylase